MLTMSPGLQAVTLSQAISLTEGSSYQGFELKEKVLYKKKSNFFDKNRDYTLGTFELEKGEVIAGELKVLEAVLKKLKSSDELLRQGNTSFNQLSKPAPHSSFLLLDEFQITQGSDLYPELKKVFDVLATKKWSLQEGMKLSADLKHMTKHKYGVATAPEPFSFSFACSKVRPPAYCLFKDLGILYVE